MVAVDYNTEVVGQLNIVKGTPAGLIFLKDLFLVSNFDTF